MASGKKSEEKKTTPDGGPLEEESLFPVRGYVWLNLIFWAFCAVEVLIVRLWLKDIQGVVFFFGLLAAGFTIVSIYDCLYDRIAARRAAERGESPAAAAENST